MENKYAIFAVIAILLIGGYFLFMTTRQTPTPAPVPQPMEDDTSMMDKPESTQDEMAMEEDVKVFEITGSAFSFSPNEITVQEGDTVKIVFTSEDGTHDWVLDEFNAKTSMLNAGETEEITFVADAAGTYEFYCNVGNHRAMGMVGTLIVE